MESVILTVSNRDVRVEAKRGIREELEASPFTNGIRFSTHPRMPVGIYSLRKKGEDGDNDLGACWTYIIPKQLPKSTMGAQSVSATMHSN